MDNLTSLRTWVYNEGSSQGTFGDLAAGSLPESEWRQFLDAARMPDAFQRKPTGILFLGRSEVTRWMRPGGQLSCVFDLLLEAAQPQRLFWVPVGTAHPGRVAHRGGATLHMAPSGLSVLARFCCNRIRTTSARGFQMLLRLEQVRTDCRLVTFATAWAYRPPR